MMNFEEGTRPKFDFGQSEAELQEIENMISQFKKFLRAFPEPTKKNVWMQ